MSRAGLYVHNSLTWEHGRVTVGASPQAEFWFHKTPILNGIIMYFQVAAG